MTPRRSLERMIGNRRFEHAPVMVKRGQGLSTYLRARRDL